MDKILFYSEEKISSVHTPFKRYLYDSIQSNTNRIIGVIGVRGIGKTTLLLQIAKSKEKSVYISMDSSFVVGKSLFSIIEEGVKKYDLQNFFIDEIHKYKFWEQDLKTVYDFLPNINIFFSGSSSINLIKGNYDLSRRGKLFHLEKFSFSEYLSFKYNINISKYPIEDIIQNSNSISFEIYKNNKNILPLFKEYLNIGELGFSLEGERNDYFEKLENIINKIIYEDISSFYKLKTEHLSYFFEILKFIANSSPSEINYSNIAKLLGTTSNTVKSYVEILIEIGILHAMGKSGKISIQLRKTKKIFFEMQNFMNIFCDSINQENYRGVLRESFVASILSKQGKIFYPNKGDIEFIKNNTVYTFEIGGKNKTSKQLLNMENAYIIADDIEIGTENKIPIWLLGFIS